ncbi:hypothetical protein GCM10007981_08230 [Thermocladium modestius]|uniref:UPF0179 protein GCM10007981_08230 n=1 Tax=Thermocladium modestius TaxID=62609 RepID=A0A830GXQ3_9CREN|nr:UPF0179 family protein [Thermocladium modestius]GGP20382.1 hypothetical protein GCM10007981_08230 [Thermocladium modestius]
MDYDRTRITLIGKEQAIVGSSFKVFGIPDECHRCKLYDICMGRLRPGRTYRIIDTKPLSLPSPFKCLLTGDNMVPVAVVEDPIIVPLKLRYVVEGMIVTYDSSACNCPDVKCPDSSTLSQGTKVKVIEILSTRNCNGSKIFMAKVLPMD